MIQNVIKMKNLPDKEFKIPYCIWINFLPKISQNYKTIKGRYFELIYNYVNIAFEIICINF